MVKKRSKTPKRINSLHAKNKKTIPAKAGIKFRQRVLSPESKKARKFVNSDTFRHTLSSKIRDGKVVLGGCDTNLGSPKKDVLQKIFDITRRPIEKNAEVAALCLDAACNKKVIAKILPIFIRDNLKAPGESRAKKEHNPAVVEPLMMKMLTDQVILKDISPNITMFFSAFKCKEATQLFNTHPFLKFLLKRKQIEPELNILVAEFVNGSDLNKFITQRISNNKESTELMRSILFQVLYTLTVLQDLFEFMHNDLHGGNVLIDTSIPPGGVWKYTIKTPAGKGGLLKNTTFYIPNEGVQAKLWDFDFATTLKSRGSVKRVRNSKVFSDKFEAFGIREEFNPSYDIFFLFMAILFHPRVKPPTEVKEFIESVIPKKLLNFNVPGQVASGRMVKINDKVPTPRELLAHKFFKKYRTGKKPNALDVLQPEYKLPK